MSGNMNESSTDAPLAAATSEMHISSEPGPAAAAEHSYSHDKTLAAICSFYEVVKRAHFEAELQYPPAGGWPQIPVEANSAVNKLLRNTPYFFNEDETLFIMDKTYPINYVEAQTRGLGEGTESIKLEEEEQRPEDEEADVQEQEQAEDEPAPEVNGFPKHIVAIAWNSGRYGYRIYIDTERNAVIRHSYEGLDPVRGETPDLDSLDDPWSEESFARAERYAEMHQRDPLAWRRAPTYRIETFFNMCIRNYLECAWMPVLEELGRGEAQVGGEERMRIMKECGWPGETWDKERAAAEMDAVIENGGDL